MKPVVFRYGLYSAIIIIVLGAIHLAFLDQTGFAVGEVIGYLTITIAMIFVFLGIKHYRDRVNGGRLTFGQGMKLGLLIVLVPSLAFGLLDIFYTNVIDPGFFQNYLDYQITEVRKNYSGEAAETRIEKMRADMEMFKNPIWGFLFMFLTVFVIGVVVTIISSLTLRRAGNRNLSQA